MGKTCKVIVCGAPGVGKTSIIETAIYGEYANKEISHTKEDLYLAQVDTDRNAKEQIRILDTSGTEWLNPGASSKNYFHFGEGFILVYSITDRESFRCVEAIKREIDKAREKKDVAIVLVGNKGDLDKHRQVDDNSVQKWAAKEKVKVFNTSAANRTGLLEPFTYVCSRLTQPPQKSTLLGSRRQKQTSAD